MRDKVKILKDELTIEADENSLVAKLIAGSKGKVKIKTPFGEREVKVVKEFSKPKKSK